MKVLVSDSISENGVEILKKAGLEVDVKTGLKPDELKAVIGDYHALIVRSATKATAEIIEAASNLKVIGRAGSGLDNVDKGAASKRGIVVMNTPGGNTITTAEHTIAMMFAVARKIPQANASMAEGKWEKKKFMGAELYNKVLGIIGLGNIGGEVARRAQGLEMQVIAYDPFLNEERARQMGIEKVEIPELIRRADFITLHTPLTNETRNLVRAETISTMKDGVYIINCARGGIINEKDLFDALESGKVAGAALDVFEKEPPENNPLVGHPKVVCTPHLGASTQEAQENVAIAVAEQIADYLVHGTIRNAVNFPSIPADQVSALQPYITLADQMGAFASQILGGEITGVSLEYKGEVSCLNISPLTIAALKGILSPILEETVNFVNAPFIARERGIEVKETRSSDAGDYHSMIAITIKSPKQELQVAGTLFSRKDPRVVKINDFSVEIAPEGYMLFMYNNDKPGVIGNIGSTLGRNGINIARMHFGREREGGMAISVVNIDSPVSDTVLDEIRKLPNILEVKVINL
ncbi:MAG: phosphoglycerate dehydrogenase [Alphaproteobacteria bacterium]|uniref:D-3-phosphoglycerate dehydrogenase n=1 Tax=Candidatus Nitrobium versatile TaxID=2884831 RepID=A0A953M0L9_9BACT|nr:phosphoglycerate dehydrogenase [Candidatus Nitrobium versatile]